MVKKKSNVKKKTHQKDISEKIKDYEYDNEMKSLKKHMSVKLEMHPYLVAMLVIVLILFLTAAFLAYQSFFATVVVVSPEKVPENLKEEIFIPVDSNGQPETRPEAEINNKTEEVIKDVSCRKIDFSLNCNTFYTGNECELAIDGNNNTQWLAQSSCRSGRNPCPVNNYVTINSSEEFRYVKLVNRIEPNYYINRIIFSYNNINMQTETLGYEYKNNPSLIKLVEPTKDLQVHIVEIVGIGQNYLTGLSEVEVFAGVCE